jgi:hypothetical protein
VAQATVVNQFVKNVLQLNSASSVIVLGDLNDFHWSLPLIVCPRPSLQSILNLPDTTTTHFCYVLSLCVRRSSQEVFSMT